MPRTYAKYTDEDIIRLSSEVFSMAELLRRLGLRPVGGNYYTIKKKLKRLELTCDHWVGQAWNKGERTKDWSNYVKTSSIKPHLIKERTHCCEVCCSTQWLEKPIPLEIHHVDGDRTNNKKQNLQLLCPNCHAFTDNYRGKNIEVSTS